MKKISLKFLPLFILSCLSTSYAQVPTISSFAPMKGHIGTSVTITGTNFSLAPDNNIVFFGATRATVNNANKTKLIVTVPAGATYQPITVTVNKLTAYSSAPFVVTFSSNQEINSNSFSDHVDFATEQHPFALAIADFDNDGKLDMATSDPFSEAVSVFMNKSSMGAITESSFGPKVDFETGYGPYGLAVADLDGDGKKDLVTIYNGTTISIFLNVSDADPNGYSSFASRVDILIGYNIALYDIAIEDLDGDGKPDLVITDQWIGKRILVFKNTSTEGNISAASFATYVEFATAGKASEVAIADLDGDGKPDLAVTNIDTDVVSVFKNECTAGTIDINSFAPRVDFQSGIHASFGIAIGDLDDDGKPDIAVSNYYTNSISILKNTTIKGEITSNSFAPKIEFATVTGPQTIAMGDLNGDGKLDLAAANFSANITDCTANKISVFKNLTTPGDISANSFAPKVDFATGLNPVTVVIGDIDGDARPELVVTNSNGNTVSVLRNKESQPLYNVVDEPAGDQETVQYETFKETQLYPNPAYNLLTIKLGGFKDTDDVNVVLLDGVGKIITRQVGKSGQELNVDVENYASGFYYVMMTQGSLKQRSRFIKL